ncbi:MAG: hypothetical protein IJL25_06530 [Clostridia bacterium]|nr:hypothetical protein [Clostridia bacterium]MBR5423930.1 hypothetical protein [Clostridia bacterium]
MKKRALLFVCFVVYLISCEIHKSVTFYNGSVRLDFSVFRYVVLPISLFLLFFVFCFLFQNNIYLIYTMGIATGIGIGFVNLLFLPFYLQLVTLYAIFIILINKKIEQMIIFKVSLFLFFVFFIIGCFYLFTAINPDVIIKTRLFYKTYPWLFICVFCILHAATRLHINKQKNGKKTTGTVKYKNHIKLFLFALFISLTGSILIDLLTTQYNPFVSLWGLLVLSFSFYQPSSF